MGRLLGDVQELAAGGVANAAGEAIEQAGVGGEGQGVEGEQVEIAVRDEDEGAAFGQGFGGKHVVDLEDVCQGAQFGTEVGLPVG